MIKVVRAHTYSQNTSAVADLVDAKQIFEGMQFCFPVDQHELDTSHFGKILQVLC